MRSVYSADWVLPVEAEPIRDGAVVVEEGRVAAVGPAADLGWGRRFEEAVIVPGFVNAHTHLEYAVYAGMGDGLEFGRWIILHMERKRRLAWDDFVAIARCGAAESLTSGVTTVADASFSGAAAVACDELGLRAIAHLEVFGAAEDLEPRFEASRERIADSLSERVQLGVSPHAPYTCAPDLYAACLELGLPVATHLAESDAETTWMRHGTGPWEQFADVLPPPPGETAIRHLATHGLLAGAITAAHCVKADLDEVALLAEHGVGVAHCPRSNALLGCGIAPLAELRLAGVRVGLGTDSPNSAISFDMFDEMRTAVFAARARTERADALSASDALELATLGGARAIGLEADVGSLVAGKRADLAVVSLEGTPHLPWEDPATAVVFGGSPERVLLTVVDGEIRYEKGVTDCRELIAAGARARSLMLAPQRPHGAASRP